MADDKPEKSTSVSPVIIVSALVAVVAIAAAGYFFMNNKTASDGMNDEIAAIAEDADYPPMPESIDGSGIESAGRASNGIEPAAEDDLEVDTQAAEESDREAPAAEIEKAEAKTGIDAFLAERAMGDPSAPIRIDEFASLTCSHCASFHNNTLAAVKEKYVDTGKVYFVFNDFPLDKAALDASITARCLPEDKYEAFISLLFKTQRVWAAEGYIKALQQNAKLAGLSDKEFKECHENSAYRKGLEAKIQSARENYDIQSTPTFILNNGEDTIRGASSIKTFDQVIGKLLAEEEAN